MYAESETADRKASQVEIEESHVAEELEHLSKRVEALAERFRSVLRQDTVEAKPESQPEEVLVPLASFLRNQRRTVQQISARINDIINTCEL